MNYYYFYRLEHGLSAAEQRAADQRAGELAAALADARGAVALNLCRGLGALKDLVGRVNRRRKAASVAAAASHVGH
jgi:hypothetical protein